MGPTQLALMLSPPLLSGPDPREDLALLMEPGVVLPAALTALPPGGRHSRSGSSGSEGSKTSEKSKRTSKSASPETAPQALPAEPQQAPQTLVGVLEIWIKNWPALHAAIERERDEKRPAQSPVTPVAGAGQQHALLNAQSAAARAPPVATSS
jgi:hypothetical protein